MDILKDKKVLLAVLLAVVFAVSAFLVVRNILSKKPADEGTSWQVSGAVIDDQHTIAGWSESGFDGDAACLRLENEGKQLPVTVKKTETGPEGVYEGEACEGETGMAPGGNGRNGPLRIAQVVPCATGVVLQPGENCSLGVRLVGSGSPGGELDITTEVTCTSREIAPCRLLREDQKPTEQNPLALTVDQESGFPKSDSGFEITTEKAELTAVETEPGKTTPATEPVPESSVPTTDPGPVTETEPVTPTTETTETTSPEVTGNPPGSDGPDDHGDSGHPGDPAPGSQAPPS